MGSVNITDPEAKFSDPFSRSGRFWIEITPRRWMALKHVAEGREITGSEGFWP